MRLIGLILMAAGLLAQTPLPSPFIGGGSGGGGTPGGSDTQCQYNNSGAFGGITGCTTNGTAVTLVAPALGTPSVLVLTNATGLPAASILPGTFGAGNYTVNGNLTVGTSLSVDGTTGIAATSKLANVALNTITAPLMLTAGVPSAATAANIVSLFSTCSGTQYLGADGACHTPGATGANAALSNLSAVSINAGLIPQTTLSLGAQATPWQNVYIYGQGTFGSHSIKFDGTPTGNRVITFPDATATVATLDGSQALTNKTYNGNTWTAGTGTLAIAAGKTLTANNTLTISATDGITMTTPTTSFTAARTDAANTFTGVQTMTNAALTTPTIAQINDANGLPYLKSVATASAVDWLQVTNAATGGHIVDVGAAGSDTNIGISVTPKGSGQTQFISTASTPTLSASTGSAVFHQFLTGSTTSRGYVGADASGIRFLNASGSGTTIQWSDSGVVTTYATQAVAGRGLAAIYAATAQTAQVASIGATNLQCAGAVCAAGLYAVRVYSTITTTGSGTLTVTLGWTDPGQAQTFTSPGITTGSKGFEDFTKTVRLDGIAQLTYATTLSSTGTYALYVTVERLE